VRLVVQVLNLVEPYARVHAHVLGSRPRMQQERADVIAALRQGDAEGLMGVIRDSIETARTELVASMGNGPVAGVLPD
jgi:DNA-binding GntR family transcriptional regulator